MTKRTSKQRRSMVGAIGYAIGVFGLVLGASLGTASASSSDALRSSTVGIPACITDLVLPGSELEVLPQDAKTPIVLRITRVAPHGTDFRASRSLVVVLSDLHDEDALPALKRLAPRHDVVALQFVDPAESGLSGAGVFRARAAESGKEFVTRGKSQWSDPERAARELPKAGIDHLIIRTDRPYVHALRNMLRGRGFIGKGTR